MTNSDRIRLHELIYARASILEAEGIAEELSQHRHAGRVTSALITAMAVAYYRPFMPSRRPDGTKRVQIREDIALALDRDTHLNLKKFRHEACAHKDLSSPTTNIPVIKIQDDLIEIHSLLPMAIEPDECARLCTLCRKIVEILQAETAGLLKAVAKPTKGEYTLNHGNGPWLIPLNRENLDRTNLARDSVPDK